MSSLRTTRTASAIGRGDGIIGPTLGWIGHRLREWLRQRAVLAELMRLDPRTLQDLRIAREDFPAIAAGTYRRDGLRAEDFAAPGPAEPAPTIRVWPYY
jgi:uncharacterized protein YjiS (DUF1127 family)